MIAFTAEVYFSLLGQYNAAIWPLQLLAVPLALAALLLAWRPGRGGGRLVAGIVAVMWLWTGFVFHGLYFAAISFPAPVISALFVAEGLFWLWSGVVRGRLAVGGGPGGAKWAGLALAGAALLLHPLVAWASGHEWHQVDVVGVAPDSTVLLTVAILLVTGRAPLHLLAVPLLWALAAALTGWHLGSPALVALPAVALAGALSLLWRGRRGQRSEATISR